MEYIRTREPRQRIEILPRKLFFWYSVVAAGCAILALTHLPLALRTVFERRRKTSLGLQVALSIPVVVFPIWAFTVGVQSLSAALADGLEAAPVRWLTGIVMMTVAVSLGVAYRAVRNAPLPMSRAVNTAPNSASINRRYLYHQRWFLAFLGLAILAAAIVPQLRSEAVWRRPNGILERLMEIGVWFSFAPHQFELAAAVGALALAARRRAPISDPPPIPPRRFLDAWFLASITIGFSTACLAIFGFSGWLGLKWYFH